jgi:hypothetical protein
MGQVLGKPAGTLKELWLGSSASEKSVSELKNELQITKPF